MIYKSCNEAKYTKLNKKYQTLPSLHLLVQLLTQLLQLDAHLKVNKKEK